MVSALTYHFNEIKNEIVTDVTAKNGVGTQTVTTKGLWDTGAQNSAITKKAAQTLGIIGLKKANVRGVHGTQEVNVYFIEIILNNPNITVKCLVTECDELSNDGSVDLLLGMNVISKGDFVVSNFDGKTSMTFRVPSLQDTDYVAEINEYNRILKIHEIESKKGIERCPCKSGKTFKNCHGKSIYSK